MTCTGGQRPTTCLPSAHQNKWCNIPDTHKVNFVISCSVLFVSKASLHPKLAIYTCKSQVNLAFYLKGLTERVAWILSKYLELFSIMTAGLFNWKIEHGSIQTLYVFLGGKKTQKCNSDVNRSTRSAQAYRRFDHRSNLCWPTQCWSCMSVSREVFEHTLLSESGCHMYTGDIATATPHLAGQRS